jgi:HAD superfamily hydrolase (TIGR01509 family)
MKPGSKSFETVLTKEGFNPDETMFIDDGTNNIKAA